jgi:hypothetical protein
MVYVYYIIRVRDYFKLEKVSNLLKPKYLDNKNNNNNNNNIIILIAHWVVEKWYVIWPTLTYIYENQLIQVKKQRKAKEFLSMLQ